jgi:hypothetical protein
MVYGEPGAAQVITPSQVNEESLTATAIARGMPPAAQVLRSAAIDQQIKSRREPTYECHFGLRTCIVAWFQPATAA